MDTFTNKKVLSIEETVKAIRDIGTGKKEKGTDVCREYGHENQRKRFRKKRTKIVCAFEQN